MNITSLKTKINNKAKKYNLSPQDLLQMYFFERILYRISISQYKYNFIIKGGMLLSSIFEDNSRTTQDLDTMVKGLKISETELRDVLKSILEIDASDDINFTILNFREIREGDLYGGYRISIKAILDSLSVSLKIDITTGDPIIPREIEYSYKCLIDDKTIKIMAFSIYTVIAEKFETLIETMETDTRAKDFYDIYTLMNMNLDDDKLFNAIYNTFSRRETLMLLNNLSERYNIIKESSALREYWTTFQRGHYYSRNVKYDDFLDSLIKIVKIVEDNIKIFSV